ncbi:uncharacterized protein GIQ15_06510 [Arthroderma uncinatum]|uniref:uncharacterized protein n=1 Tax=Arthroderma uncinatum TaxID=74035 RepID=UPI00144A8D00|nr:uncharacterized protein GIQ15_06510 [Arthroderma uncinatum]KAF3479534.1 hypothetical protein GIQ15_06510 [Arthroderma uncinatum]
MASSDSGRDRCQNCPNGSGSGSGSGAGAGAGRDEENPFIALRRYADKQLSSLLRSVVGLPSAVLSPPAKDWLGLNDEELIRALRARRDASDNVCCHHSCRDCNSGGDEFSRPRPRYDERYYGVNAGAPRRDGDSSNAEQQRRHPSQSFPASVFDDLFDSAWPIDPSFLFRDLAHLHGPFIFDFMAPSTSAGWPISYLMFSPYSPLQLERQRQLRQRYEDHSLSSWFTPLAPSHEARDPKEPRWREAFEDLLRLENGKPMLDRDPRDVSKSESGKDWLSGLIQRGSLGDGWSHVRQPDGEGDYFKFSQTTSSDPSPENEENLQKPLENKDGHPFSELDLYDTFLHKVNDGPDATQTSPLLRAILEERKRQRRELEELQLQWKEMFREKETERADDRQAVADIARFEHATHSSQTAQGADENLPQSIISSVTTTQRLMQPDGSVKTKTIVSKRFADGREENSETEEVTRNSHLAVDDSNQVMATRDGKQQGPPDSQNKKRSGGWFWQE